MLGKRGKQRHLFVAATELGPEVIDKMGFFGQLWRKAHEIFRDEDFAAAYCANNGRPSVPPSVLAIALLLKIYEGISDREVVARTQYDLRWKVALGLPALSIAPAFARSTFQAFRARLALFLNEGLVFERSVKAACKAGLLPRQLRVALDSTPVRGRGAVKDTFNLLSDAIKSVIRSVAGSTGKKSEEVAREAGVERHFEAPSIKASEVVDWDDEESKSRFLAGLLDDCERTAALAEAEGCASEEVSLLRKIVTQDVDAGPAEEAPKIRRGVAKDRTVSVSDPEIRHGRKSSGKTYNGHKAHVAVDTESGVVTAVGLTSPSCSDGSQVGELLAQTVQNTGMVVEEAQGDTAYSSRDAIRQAEAAAVELVTKMPSPNKSQFGPRDFQVSEDGRRAQCPAGHESTRQCKDRQDGEEYIRHVWAEEQCSSCPLKEACTKAKQRTLRVGVDFHDRRDRESYARSEEGRTHLRQRVKAEHAIGRLKNIGAGTARYFGSAKTRGQLLWSAAVVNLCLVWGQQGGWVT